MNGEWKHQKLLSPDGTFSLKYNSTEKILEISSTRVVFFVMLQHSTLQFSDNGFVLLPNENKRVTIEGNINNNFTVDEIKIFTLNKYSII